MNRLRLIDEFGVLWDIPIITMKLQTRQALFHQILEKVQNTGFILPINSGLILAWKDITETKWLGKLAFRAWTCCSAPLTSNDLKNFSETLNRFEASFAALSGWFPFPECEDFLNVGDSVYAAVDNIRQTKAYDIREYHVEIHSLGKIPEHWISQIVDHVSKTKWRDRHARDFNFNPEKVKLRRTRWIRKQLETGDGFLTAVLDRHSEFGAYLFVPLDHSRQAFGGPVIAGLNGLSGSFHEGRWLIRRAYIEAYQKMNSTWDVVIIQYQEDNKPIKRIVNRSLLVTSCTRYDLHWHRNLTRD